jgi:hypothetical protein
MSRLLESKRSRCTRCSNEVGPRQLGSARQALRLALQAGAKVSPGVGKLTARQLQALLQ